MSSGGNIDLAPVIWWGFALCLLLATCVIVVARVVWRRGRRQ